MTAVIFTVSFDQMQVGTLRRPDTTTGLYANTVLQSKMLKLFCVFLCLMTQFNRSQSQKILTLTKKIYCYNSSHEGEYISFMYECEMSRRYAM